MLGRTLNGANIKKQENTWIRSKRMSNRKNMERWMWNIIQGTESTHNLFSLWSARTTAPRKDPLDEQSFFTVWGFYFYEK